MIVNQTMRAAVYTRVSTDEQAKEGFSLDAQHEKIQAYCKIHDLIPAGVYKDGGYSGRDTNRPAYQRMLKEIQSWDIILVYRMDRIHRNSRNFMAMMDSLQAKGKDFASVTENFDTTTAMGRFVMDIMQRIAQLESEVLGERTHMGMEEAKNQKFHVTRFPIGFQPIYNEKDHIVGFRPKLWTEKVLSDLENYGIERAIRLNKKEDGSKFTRQSLGRLKRNMDAFKAGKLLPNKVSDL